MNNQSKLARQIIYAIGTKDDLVIDRAYPLYMRYIKYIGKEDVDWFLVEKVNERYANYMVSKYVKKDDWFTWTNEDGKDLERNIKETLL